MTRIAALAAALLLAGAATETRAQDGGLVGGLLGAGAGAVIGGAATGKAGGAAAGAIIGGAAGAIIGDSTDRRRGRYAEYEGSYFWSHGKCYFEYPNGSVDRVSRDYCR
jgi:Glycine zipper